MLQSAGSRDLLDVEPTRPVLRPSVRSPAAPADRTRAPVASPVRAVAAPQAARRAAPPAARPLLAQQTIANEIATLYKTRIGRGPTRVSTTIAADVVVCVLQDTRTPQEETMLRAGADDLVQDLRARFQRHVARELVGTVERATGRPVQSHVPGYDPSSDTAVEVFVLGR